MQTKHPVYALFLCGIIIVILFAFMYSRTPKSLAARSVQAVTNITAGKTNSGSIVSETNKNTDNASNYMPTPAVGLPEKTNSLAVLFKVVTGPAGAYMCTDMGRQNLYLKFGNGKTLAVRSVFEFLNIKIPADGEDKIAAMSLIESNLVISIGKSNYTVKLQGPGEGNN